MNGRIRPGGGPCGGRSLGGTAALRPPAAPGVNRGELPRRGADDNRGLACEIPTPRMSNPVQPGDRYRPTVLVVDDNPDQRELVRHMVELRSAEHTSELQSLMRISYADFCLEQKKIH